MSCVRVIPERYLLALKWNLRTPFGLVWYSRSPVHGFESRQVRGIFTDGTTLFSSKSANSKFVRKFSHSAIDYRVKRKQFIGCTKPWDASFHSSSIICLFHFSIYNLPKQQLKSEFTNPRLMAINLEFSKHHEVICLSAITSKSN